MRVSTTTFVARLALLAVGASVATLAAACDPAPAPATPGFGFAASAYGTSASGPSASISGPSFPAGIACTTKSGLVATNSGGSSTVPAFGSTGTVAARASTSGGSTPSSSSVEDVSGVNLLGGLVRARTVHATSSSSHSALGFRAVGSTSFADLQVNNSSVTATSVPNTVVSLPGLGTVTLNEQNVATSASSATETTRAIHVRITSANLLGLPVGSDLVVGSATTRLDGPVAGVLGGVAYGTQVKVAGAVTSGASAVVSMPCLGTNGQLTTNTAAGATPPRSSTGGVVDTARGTVTGSAGNGELASTIKGVNLVSSLVTATSVKADAHATTDGRKLAFTDAGSQFTNLRVRGFSGVNDQVAANTMIVVPGVGNLYLRREIRTPNGLEVRMIELVVTMPVQGMQVGTDIQVAVASAVAY